jgi:hypothetical protein
MTFCYKYATSSGNGIFVASRFARQLGNYNHFMGSIKDILTDLITRGSNACCLDGIFVI